VIGSTAQIVTASIGIAILDECADNAVDLLKCADVAMYRAKEEGRNQSQFYSAELQDAVQHRANMKHDLHHALERGEFRIYYQAQIRPADGTLGGMEALLRWHHPRLGVLLPADFIPLAEETGLIVPIGDWVLREACRQLKQWQSHLQFSERRLSLAVNLSPIQLREQALLSSVENALKEFQLDPSSLELEITESALIKDPSGTVGILSALAAIGVTLSLDDFGTGYSSLQHLRLFPTHVLKIDRTFIATIGHGANSDRLLVAMIRFAQALDLRVVAEGVETKAQAIFCDENGCDLLQGYYYSRPVPAEDFERAFLRPSPAGRSYKPANDDTRAPRKPLRSSYYPREIRAPRH
jgi:EAL domain-containing protein (putative c-di-GMP-specific phosphodiesterase class I)